jgi:hypothetical protein
MLSNTLFKKRRVLRKNEIQKLLNEQDQMSVKFLRKELEVGCILDVVLKEKSVANNTIILSIIYNESYDKNRLYHDDADLLIGTTCQNIFNQLKEDWPRASIILFENLSQELCNIEFCKIVSAMQKIKQYKYVVFDDLSHEPYVLQKSLSSILNMNRVFFPIIYTDASNTSIKSDISLQNKDVYYLKYPVRNVSASCSFITTSGIFLNTPFEIYTFACDKSLFYSFLINHECCMTKLYHLQK